MAKIAASKIITIEIHSHALLLDSLVASAASGCALEPSSLNSGDPLLSLLPTTDVLPAELSARLSELDCVDSSVLVVELPVVELVVLEVLV